MHQRPPALKPLTVVEGGCQRLPVQIDQGTAPSCKTSAAQYSTLDRGGQEVTDTGIDKMIDYPGIFMQSPAFFTT